MPSSLSPSGYYKLIKEDIDEVMKCMAEDTLERRHIIHVLKDSVECYYPKRTYDSLEAESVEELRMREQYYGGAHDGPKSPESP